MYFRETCIYLKEMCAYILIKIFPNLLLILRIFQYDKYTDLKSKIYVTLTFKYLFCVITLYIPFYTYFYNFSIHTMKCKG